MVSVPVQCPHCHSTAVIKAGKQANGTQRYQCQTADARSASFSCGIRIEAGYPRSTGCVAKFHSQKW